MPAELCPPQDFCLLLVTKVRIENTLIFNLFTYENPPPRNLHQRNRKKLQKQPRRMSHLILLTPKHSPKIPKRICIQRLAKKRSYRNREKKLSTQCDVLGKKLRLNF